MAGCFQHRCASCCVAFADREHPGDQRELGVPIDVGVLPRSWHERSRLRSRMRDVAGKCRGDDLVPLPPGFGGTMGRGDSEAQSSRARGRSPASAAVTLAFWAIVCQLHVSRPPADSMSAGVTCRGSRPGTHRSAASRQAAMTPRVTAEPVIAAAPSRSLEQGVRRVGVVDHSGRCFPCTRDRMDHRVVVAVQERNLGPLGRSSVLTGEDRGVEPADAESSAHDRVELLVEDALRPVDDLCRHDAGQPEPSAVRDEHRGAPSTGTARRST